jgi:integrase
VLDVFEDIINPDRLRSISARTLTAFVKGVRQRVQPLTKKVGLAAWTQKNYLIALKSALGWAVTQGFLSELPEFPEVKAPKKKPQPISPDEFEKLLAEAPDARWKAFLLCGWWGGLRLSKHDTFAGNGARICPGSTWRATGSSCRQSS